MLSSRKNIVKVKRESTRQKERKAWKKRNLKVEVKQEEKEDSENEQIQNGISKKPIRNGG